MDRVKSLGAVHGEKNRGVFNWLAASQGLLPALPFPLIALAGGAIAATAITTPGNRASAIGQLPSHLVDLLKIRGAPFGAFPDFRLLKSLVFKAFRSGNLGIGSFLGFGGFVLVLFFHTPDLCRAWQVRQVHFRNIF